MSRIAPLLRKFLSTAYCFAYQRSVQPILHLQGGTYLASI
jgi:hypothetical protein